MEIRWNLRDIHKQKIKTVQTPKNEEKAMCFTITICTYLYGKQIYGDPFLCFSLCKCMGMVKLEYSFASFNCCFRYDLMINLGKVLFLFYRGLFISMDLLYIQWQNINVCNFLWFFFCFAWRFSVTK